MSEFCRNCNLAIFCKSGSTVEKLNKNVVVHQHKDGEDFIVRDCLSLDDDNWEKDEITDIGAGCVHPERFVPIVVNC